MASLDEIHETLCSLSVEDGSVEVETQTQNLNALKLADLPAKVLASIFKYIPLQNLDDIIELSPQWNKIVQDNIPVEVHLTDIGFRIALHYFIGYEELSKYRIKVIHSRVLDEKLPELKSPEDLQVLEFATHTELQTYKSLVSYAVNLQEIHFGYSSLLGHVLSDVNVSFPNLKVLAICDRAIEAKSTDIQDPNVLPRNIVGFLRKTFPKIQKLIVITEANREKTIDYACELLKFIQNNHQSLRIIKFKIGSFIQNDEATHDLHSFPVEDHHLKEIAAVKLEDLELSFGKRFFVGLEHWISILNNQTRLAHLAVGSEKLLNPAIFVSPITQSAVTLTTVNLGLEVFDSKTLQRYPFDCEVFENCTNLKMVILTGPTYLAGGTLRPPCPELLNVSKLPNGVLCLGVENIYVETEQLKEMSRGAIQKERSLEKLSLCNVGAEGEYGVTLSMIDGWMKEKALMEIIVKGVNGEDSQLSEFLHFIPFGLKVPFNSCKIHACYFPKLNGFRKPMEDVPSPPPY